MKVTYLFREKRSGNFSIEELFANISEGVSEYHEVTQFYCKGSNRLKNVADVHKLESDVFHITGDVNYLTMGLPAAKTIITLHDLGYYENPVNKGYRKLIYEWLWLRIPFKRARYITTVSEFTRTKLLQYFPEYVHKCVVVPNPVHADFTYAAHEFNSERPHILMIGTGPHKNFERLFESVVGMPVILLIVGRLNEVQIKYLEQQGISYQNYYNISKETLISLYKKADLLYFASLYEGFGMPIIEANKVGLPVITSNAASMPEVAGHAALIVDPYDIADIKKAVTELIASAALRVQLIQEGLENAKRFSLEQVRKQYIDLYDQTVAT